MDANGARVLLARIGSNHWSRAGAVREGRQPAHDPDADRLVELGDGFRLYADGAEKHLVGDAWAPTTFVVERSDAAA